MNNDRDYAWKNIMQCLENIKTYATFLDNTGGERDEVENAAERFIRSARKIKYQNE